MTESRRVHGQRVEGGSIVLAGVLLLGLGVVAWGYYQGSHPVLYVGLFVILAGVLSGVRRLIAGDSGGKTPGH